MSALALPTDPFSLDVLSTPVGDEKLAAIFSVAALDELESVDLEVLSSDRRDTCGDEELAEIFSLATHVELVVMKNVWMTCTWIFSVSAGTTLLLLLTYRLATTMFPLLLCQM